MANATCNRTVVFLVASLAHKDKTSFTEGYREAIPGVRVLPAVNGYNQTETIEAVLESGLKFHNLSLGGRTWGHLATVVTKYRCLQHQIRNRIPFQLTLEDDLRLRPEFFRTFVAAACERYDKRPGWVLVQLSRYSEAMLTSLAGATRLAHLIQRVGIVKNNDQALLDPRVLLRGRQDLGRHIATEVLPAAKQPWELGRPTNGGDILATREITFAEQALLRLLTDPAARSLPSFGNPPGTDTGHSTDCRLRQPPYCPPKRTGKQL